MFKKSILTNSLLLALVAPSVVMAEVEATIELRNETAVYTRSGQTIGQATSTTDTTTNNSSGDLMKFQNQAKIFLNGDIGEDSSWHAEVQIIYDAEAINSEDNGGINYKGHEDYTQNDFFRELYVDTEMGDWSFRLGKQQVVWGTADGIKLLDIINPTDFREVNQNVMEDARIPVWMINAERSVGDNGNFQFIVSQAEPNKIPGLNASGDQGQPFVMLGTDSITGKVNGFLNIVPALGSVSTTFNETARFGNGIGQGFDLDNDGNADNIANRLTGFAGLTVAGFAGRNQIVNDANNPAVICSNPAGCGFGGTQADGGLLLNNFVQSTNNNVTNLTTSVFEETDPDSAFEYMPMATFATFNTFAGQWVGGNPNNGLENQASSEYVRDYDEGANAGFRFKFNTDSGVNYSLNYFYHFDSNPSVNASWHDVTTNEKLTTVYATNASYGAAGYYPDPTNHAGATVNGSVLTRTQARAAVRNGYTLDGNGNATNAVNVLLRNNAGQYYGAISPNPNDGAIVLSGNAIKTRFTESNNRIHSLGGAFDMAIDSLDVPLVLRGEFLYDKDVNQTILDKALLSIGDLEGALTSEQADMVKYVIGVDVTVMTNLLVSGQFIQFINLDHVNDGATCTTQVNTQFDCSRYTIDPATMHLTNGLQQGWETKEWVSLFFSKPIGEDQLGRWNNITIWEEGGGFWNRLDAEYSVTDQFIVSGEWNHYWGDENTTFGQLENSSNVQVGFKYIFEDY